MKILVFTHMYPSSQHPENGIFVQQQVESLRREGIDVDVLHVDVKKSRWLYLWSFVPFLKQVLTQRYDLVHAHYVFAGVVARSQMRFPLVITQHGDEAFYGWQAPLCRIVSRFSDATIAVTQEIRKSVGTKNCFVIPCGVDFDLFRPVPQLWARTELNLPSDKKLVLFVGNVPEYRKRFDLVKDAVVKLQQRGLNVELVIAYKLPYQRVPLYMNACDVLVLPSEREGSPQVVKEAMACNLPVVVASVGDVPDVLSGVDGCYLCERTVDDVTEKTLLALEWGARTNGRQATQRYELQSIARQIIEVYKKVLGGSCPQ